ncbi:hypothetical protein JVU11DRAFT_6893 [Chiua virens]|nr:hypothetical protein JVU11DRAFT_6893 [Chiua virens]
MARSELAGHAHGQDPGILPNGPPSSHGKTTQQTNLQPSGIPRCVGIPPSPATSRIPTAGAQTSSNGSDVATPNPAQREKRLFVTNAEISSSSSTEGQAPLTRFIKPKTLVRTDSQSSAESQLRPPRFGLGLGLSGFSGPRNQDKLSPSQKWTAKIPSDGSASRRSTSPNNKKGQRDAVPKRRDRSPSRHLRVDGADGQRRRRELLSLVHPDLDDSSGCDSRPSSSDGFNDRCLVSDGSGDSLRSAFDDSGSEYSPAEEDTHRIRQTLTRRDARPQQTRSKAIGRQHRINPTGDDNELPRRVDEQYTPRASSNPSFSQQGNGYPVTKHDEEPLESESSTLASDGDARSIDETLSPAIPQRYSSELSRIMAVSMAAASRQRQAFGISSTFDLEDCQAGSSELPPADSDLSLIGGVRWQDECDELATGSLLQRQDRSRGADDRQTSFSQESIYSTPNSPKRRSSTGIVVPDSPPAVPTVREQLWQTFERHLLDTYGDVEVRRHRFVWELTESEDGFVKQLQNMIQLFILPLRVRDTRMWVSGIPSDVTKLFDWLDDIVRVHAQLSAALAARQIVDHPRLQIISEVFRGFIPRLETYQPYLVKLEFTASVIDGLIHEGKNDFGDFIKLQEASERCRGWSLEKYLIEPVNRLAQYPEMFRASVYRVPCHFTDIVPTVEVAPVDAQVSPRLHVDCSRSFTPPS